MFWFTEIVVVGLETSSPSSIRTPWWYLRGRRRRRSRWYSHVEIITFQRGPSQYFLIHLVCVRELLGATYLETEFQAVAAWTIELVWSDCVHVRFWTDYGLLCLDGSYYLSYLMFSVLSQMYCYCLWQILNAETLLHIVTLYSFIVTVTNHLLLAELVSKMCN